MIGSIFSKAATVGWYLGHPSLYKELGRRMRRWQVTTEATRREATQRRAEGQRWCAEHAGPMAEFAESLSLPAEIVPLEQAFPREWGFALGAESQCPVAVGGPGHLDLLYHVARHLKAERAVETGVANGWSTLALLLAMHRVPGARLVSVDMPYAKLGNARFVGCVVAPHLRDPWTLVRAPDRDALPGVLAELGQIDLAHYDSDKTYEGRMFAYPLLWERLRPGGVLLSDDIEYDDGFGEFASSVERRAWVFEKPHRGNYCGAIVK
jgi:predicted O-methyltransferase YrrM